MEVSAAVVRETSISSHVTAIGGAYAAVMVSPVTSADRLLSLTLNMTCALSNGRERRPHPTAAGWHASNESGRSEIYVEPAARGRGKSHRRRRATARHEAPETPQRYEDDECPVQVQPVPGRKAMELLTASSTEAVSERYDVLRTVRVISLRQANPTEIRVVMWPGPTKK